MMLSEKYYCTYECQDEKEEFKRQLKNAHRKIKQLEKQLDSLKKENKEIIQVKRTTHDRLNKLYRDTKNHREELLYLLNDTLQTLLTPNSDTIGTSNDIIEALEKYGYFAKTKQEKNQRIREINNSSSP